MKRWVVLDNLRSAYNVGAIFRSASGAGVSEIVCVGITATPLDRFGDKRRDIAKTALGAEDIVPWRYAPSVVDLRGDFRSLIAVEQTPHSVPYHKFTYPDDCAFVFGPEVGGLSKETLSLCGEVIEIPMAQGGKESLNVSVACGIVLFHSKHGTTKLEQ